jgi:hypothetical protein
MHYFFKEKLKDKNKNKKRTRTGAARTDNSDPIFGPIKQRLARGSLTAQ